jgi:predicted transcriptional regulator
MARPSHEPNATSRRQVEAMAAYGITEPQIARVVGIDPKTLRKHYRDELDTGQIKANSKVAESLYRKATTDGPQSVTAAIFWLKTRARWKETQVSELTGRDGGPIETKETSALDLIHRRIAGLAARAEAEGSPDRADGSPG